MINTLQLKKMSKNIYLCKGNACDPVLVSAIRKRYAEQNLLEHPGGKYDPQLIKKADVIIVAPNFECNRTTRYFEVGKGQLSEIRNNPEHTRVYLSKDYIFIGVSDISDIHVFDEGSWTNCARIYINGAIHNEADDRATSTERFQTGGDSIKQSINEEELLL